MIAPRRTGVSNQLRLKAPLDAVWAPERNSTLGFRN